MKIGLVTGVSRKSGIGYGICKKLLKENYKIFAIYNTDNECEDELKQSFGDKVVFFQCDFTNKLSVDNLIRQLKNFKFDLIINNAGKFADGEDYSNYDMNVWDEIFEVNTRTPMAISV